ncbi:glycosyltransferase family 2 protein [Gemmobacter denitrificans]|uniref:Glycosyltransferase n=1 Tax=Gemmobacter denitrificans TaxID=3123040 RepID=A0ABU8C0G5_9RHOB
MRLSFIVTSFDILPYVDPCLTSLAAVVRPGDRVILVDDGSTDGTAERIEAWQARGFGAGVGVKAVLLGTNTMGGVGIGGNIGLSEALSDPDCEGVFFVDGDDWLEPGGFAAARLAFERGGADILLGNYGEYDDQTQGFRRPADAARWGHVARLGKTAGPQSAAQTEAARDLALSMIAVPWRKFYRADFLRRHGLRFPEGAFFFEDNPFHWAVCLAAGRIGFLDVILCQHRINRPGQTMASTGAELIAFFDHYETITALVTAQETARAEAALDWLLNNMSWHLDRLAPEAFWAYAGRAAEVLTRVPEPLWQGSARRFSRRPVGGIAAALRRGDVAGVVGVWVQQAEARALHARLEEMDPRALLARLDNRLQAEAEIARFAALSALSLPALPPLP